MQSELNAYIIVSIYVAVSNAVPFGGYKASGIGRELGMDAIKEYTQVKSIHWNYGESLDWPRTGRNSAAQNSTNSALPHFGICASWKMATAILRDGSYGCALQVGPVDGSIGAVSLCKPVVGLFKVAVAQESSVRR